MKFHLQFPIEEISPKVNYNHKIAFVGSCFAEETGNLFLQHKFKTTINSHGILYNPYSIANAINECIQLKKYSESDLFFYNEQWHSWQHHSKFSNVDKNNALENINKNIVFTHNFLSSANWLIITLGSSFVYKHIERNEFVGNCHKVAQKIFSKHLLEVSEITAMLNSIVNELGVFNKNLKIIFTVSPVRYIRDGIVQNTLSKARLIEAVHQIVATHNNCNYFPSYELVMDDLRDYRFYKEDLVHPSEQAIHYVFEKFISAAFDDESKTIYHLLKEINAAKKHRPFNIDSEQHQLFKKTFLEKCIALKNKYSFLDVGDEIAFFKS